MIESTDRLMVYLIKGDRIIGQTIKILSETKPLIYLRDAKV